jgi:hypothetical protein
MAGKIRRTNTKVRSVAKPYEPTPEERRLIEAYLARTSQTPAAPLLKVSEDNNGKIQIVPDHADLAVAVALLMEAFATTDPCFALALINQLSYAGSYGRKVNETELNFMLSVVKGAQPKDQMEAMLAAQMAAVHIAMMTFARRLALVETIPQQDSAERAFNKLARTFAAQMEALKRYRSRGDQTVRVEHVTVNEGGQAIVGNVAHREGGNGDDEG